MIQTVTLIGAGNLATQLGKALIGAGVKVNQLYSRTEQSASELASKLKTSYTTNLRELVLDSDLIIVSVKDDALGTVLSELEISDQLIVHTAGSIPMSVLARFSNSYGVFYPLQTFSKNRDLEFTEIPICLEASNNSGLQLLRELASKLSNHVVNIDSEQRQYLHLSAVFTCNFVNHFYYLSGLILEDKGLSFDLLKPLISETAAKVQVLKPIDAQTGPAVRFDESIINKHLKMLEDHPELRKIYSFVTDGIHKTHNK